MSRLASSTLLSLSRKVNLCFAAVLALSAVDALKAQAPYMAQVDLAVGGTGLFTRVLPDQISASGQGATDAAGGLLSIREHPYTWAGLEENIQYSHFYESATVGTSDIDRPVALYEISGAYLVSSHARTVEPFASVGGGALLFRTGNAFVMGPAGSLEAGLDLPSANPHLGLRVEGRSLFYRRPSFLNQRQQGPWLATFEPSLSLYFRF